MEVLGNRKKCASEAAIVSFLVGVFFRDRVSLSFGACLELVL